MKVKIPIPLLKIHNSWNKAVKRVFYENKFLDQLDISLKSNELKFGSIFSMFSCFSMPTSEVKAVIAYPVSSKMQNFEDCLLAVDPVFGKTSLQLSNFLKLCHNGEEYKSIFCEELKYLKAQGVLFLPINPLLFKKNVVNSNYKWGLETYNFIIETMFSFLQEIPCKNREVPILIFDPILYSESEICKNKLNPKFPILSWSSLSSQTFNTRNLYPLVQINEILTKNNIKPIQWEIIKS